MPKNSTQSNRVHAVAHIREYEDATIETIRTKCGRKVSRRFVTTDKSKITCFSTLCRKVSDRWR